jgi:multidrug efflux pump subunit AcrA (membrane-fusion protein)
MRLRGIPVGRAAFAALAAALVFSGCSQRRPPTVVHTRVPVVTAVPGTVAPANTLGGIIVPFQNVAIQNSLSEPTLVVNVQAGDQVSKGDVLARLDTSDLVANLKATLATAAANHAKWQQTYLQADLTIQQNSNSINAAKAAVTQAQTTLNTDTLNLKRDADLLKQGYISQQAYDQQQTVVTNDQQALRSAQVNLQNQQSQVQVNGTTSTGLQGAQVDAAKAAEQTALAQADQIRAMIARATIVSPVDGIVVNRNLNPGEYPGTRQIFTIQEMDKVYAVLNGSGAQVVGVQPGSMASITATDRATIKSRGKVIAVLDQLTPGSTNFTIKVLLPNPQRRFHAGMVVSGLVHLPPSRGIRVPVTAFNDDSSSSVQVVENGTVKTVPVTMVAQDGKNAVVNGLPQGAQVVVNGQLGLAEGQSVEPIHGQGRSVAGRF